MGHQKIHVKTHLPATLASHRLSGSLPSNANAIVRALGLTIGLLGTIGLASADQQPIDCALPHVDIRMQQCVVVRHASEFSGCLSAQQITEHSCVLMDADLTFCDNQAPIAISAIFDRSDKTLDCAGGVIDHGWSRHGPVAGVAPSKRDKQMPFVRFFDDRSLSNITIKNCEMRGTFHAGLQLTRFFGGELGADGKLDEGEALPIGHKNVLIQNVQIDGGQVGIYLGNYSQDITMDRVIINGSERIALYSEAGSHRIRLSNSIISNNRSREAVAIDSTYDSIIENTLFVNNREGGINLYQNCGELKGSVCPVVRSTPPNGNRIVGNTFVNTGVSGVQVASRQGRNHSFGWCESLGGWPGKFTDTAINNVVEDNVFVCHEGTALVVQDGPNLIRNNRIVARDQCIPLEVSTGGLGASSSHLLNGLRLEGNTIDSSRPPRLRNISSGVIFTK